MRIRTLLNIGLLLSGLAAGRAGAAEGGATETLQRLPESKHTLIEAIRQAEKTNGTPISAKFEFEDGKLWLSVYTAKEGKVPDAEHNTLMELKGEPAGTEWRPATEVFQDKEHVARSAAQLTLIQLSGSSLESAVQKAASAQKGTPYSAIPRVKAGRPVLEVLVALPAGKSATVDVDLQTGKATKH
ncbi:MAG TPA: PepSY domain-containing protein [Polyangiaceae bacterium]|nr:PepSY domain-containing protein [Polyangiaceae bacterium]